MCKRNLHILNLKQVEDITPSIRLEVYEKVLRVLEFTDKYKNLDCKPLCIIIPMELWDMKTFYDTTPDGKVWSYQDTTKAFPELNLKIKRITGREYKEDETDEIVNQLRATIIQECIEEVKALIQ